MDKIRSWGACLAAALLVAACGGGDPDVPGSGSPSGAPTTPGAFTRVVSFGDSLSDAGTYTPATSVTGNGAAPFLGGRFTTNTFAGTTATSRVWVENLAAALGVPLTPAEVGFGTQSVKCPAAAAASAAASTCTAYGQGGSRITDPEGIGHRGAGGALAALTVPVVTQIANHLQRFGSFQESDLVLVFAGSNDVLIQFSAFTTAAAQIQAQAAAGQITEDQRQALLFDAQTRSQAALKQAALELTGYIDTQILARGARYVAVLALTDIGDTPLGLSPQVAPVRTVLTDLSRIFNLWLREGLTGRPVQVIDTFAMFKDVAQNASALGIANITTPACDATRIGALTGGRVADGSSLFCNATAGSSLSGLRAGADPNTWFFADTIHPTTLGHRILSDAVLGQLRGFGWVR